MGIDDDDISFDAVFDDVVFMQVDRQLVFDAIYGFEPSITTQVGEMAGRGALAACDEVAGQIGFTDIGVADGWASPIVG